MQTLDPSSWTKLCETQMQRALAGDAQAAKWCAEHRPDVQAPRGGDPAEIAAELHSLSADELRQWIANYLRRLTDAAAAGNDKPLASMTDAELDAEIARLRFIESRASDGRCPHCGLSYLSAPAEARLSEGTE